MNKREKEVLQAQLDKEKAVMEQLKKQYDRSLRDIEQKTKVLMFDIQQLDEALNTDGLDDRSKEVLESRKQSKIYQKQHQEALKKQVEAITEKLHSDEYSTIEQYLKECYTDAYVGTMYDISGQGIPVITPIDQTAVVRAVMTDSKISEGLYTALGVDTKALKIAISAEISRGIATGQSYAQIAKNLNGVANTKYSNAMRIVRTEGHRIQNASTYDAQQAAKAKGCNVVKQWDSTLDGKTRPTHRELDGQIREVEEHFEAAGKKAKYPGDFGDPAEDCNCRCTTLTRARWALGEDELKTLQDRARFFGLDKSKSFEDYKKKYLKVSKMAASSDNDWSKTTAKTISTKEKQQLIQYAKSKGVDVGDIDTFDGDADLLKTEIDTVSNAINQYGIKRTIKVSSMVLGDDDFAITDGYTITFNSKALRNRAITEYNIVNGGKFASKTLEDIALHETGHIIERENNVNSIEIAKKAYYNVTGKYVSTKMINKYLTNHVSLYSSEEPTEIFAELLVCDKNNPTAFTKEFIALLKGGSTS